MPRPHPDRRYAELRAVVYARVSTLKPSQDTSIPRQLAELRDESRRRRWRLVASESDRLSGGSDDRAGLRTALEHIFTGRADVLAVHDLDRLGRDVRSMLANVDAIHAAGGNLFIRSLNIDTATTEGRLMFTIFAALAEWQRRNQRDKVIAGLAHARKKGVRLGRAPSVPQVAIDRAVVLRRRRPRPSWMAIVAQLAAEGLGLHTKSAISGLVSRRLMSPRKSTHRNIGKTPAFRRHLRAV